MSVTLAEGFVASGIAAGIKSEGRRDVSLLATDDGKPVPTAAVFTQNKFRAPPVEASLERLNVSGGLCIGRGRQQRQRQRRDRRQGPRRCRGDVRGGG